MTATPTSPLAATLEALFQGKDISFDSDNAKCPSADLLGRFRSLPVFSDASSSSEDNFTGFESPMKTCSKNLRRPQEEAAWDPSMDESLRSEDDPFLDDASGGEDFHGNPFQVDPWKKVISQTQETRWNHDVSVMGIKSIRTVQSPVIKVNKRASRRIPSSLLQLNVDGFSAKETSRENGCDLIKQAVASVEKANEIISTRRSSGLLASISKKVA